MQRGSASHSRAQLRHRLVLRIAWTVADLRGHPAPDGDDVGLAMSLRTRGQAGA